MFCPMCRDEYRSGFTRCGTCGADLVETLPTAAPHPPEPVETGIHIPEPATDYFGFLTLEDARAAREKLRAAMLPAEIVITDGPKPAPDAPAHEVYWLRVKPKDLPKVAAIIGYEHDDTPADDESFKCSACGATVGASDDACPGCGLGFEA